MVSRLKPEANTCGQVKGTFVFFGHRQMSSIFRVQVYVCAIEAIKTLKKNKFAIIECFIQVSSSIWGTTIEKMVMFTIEIRFLIINIIQTSRLGAKSICVWLRYRLPPNRIILQGEYNDSKKWSK